MQKSELTVGPTDYNASFISSNNSTVRNKDKTLASPTKVHPEKSRDAPADGRSPGQRSDTSMSLLCVKGDQT